MKKLLVVVFCVIITCSLLAAPLLLKPAPPASQSEPKTIPKSILLPTPQPTLHATSPRPLSLMQQLFSQTNPQVNPEPTLPQSTPQNTPQPPPADAQQRTNRTLEQAVGNATNYLAQTQDPYALLMLNVLHRRFGITEFKDSLQTYDEQLLSNPENALLRVFRRMADYSNSMMQPTDFKAVTSDIDRLTVPALYSDRLPLPDNYLSMLTDAENSGDYLLTHALLATIWLQDNHCSLQMPLNFEESLYQANAALIGNGSIVTDLEVEAAAFLYLAGQGTLVNDAFVQRVVATQNYDGGWSPSSNTTDSSNWHTSVLALTLLLHIEFPASSYPPMLPPATEDAALTTNPTSVFSITICLFCIVVIRKRLLQSLPEGLGSPISRRLRGKRFCQTSFS